MNSLAQAVVGWLGNGAVVLGLAISVYTIYSYAETHVRQRRQQYVLLKRVASEFEYFIALASSLGQRAEQGEQVVADAVANLSFPNPASDHDSLPEEAQAISRWLAARARHLMKYKLPLELSKLGGILNRSQADALFELLDTHRVYIQVLSARTIDLEAFPRRPGVLKRFVGVAVLNVGPMRDRLTAFATSLRLEAPRTRDDSDSSVSTSSVK